MRAVAAGDPAAVDALEAVVRRELCAQALAVVLEGHELGVAFHRHAELVERLDEQHLLLVLREDQHVREGAFALADVADLDAPGMLAARPQVHGGEGEAACERRAIDAELAVELESARVHDQGARRGARRGGLVDDAKVHAEPSQPEGEHQPRGSRADYQDIRRPGALVAQCHGVLLQLYAIDSNWAPGFAIGRLTIRVGWLRAARARSAAARSRAVGQVALRALSGPPAARPAGCRR